MSDRNAALKVALDQMNTPRAYEVEASSLRWMDSLCARLEDRISEAQGLAIRLNELGARLLGPEPSDAVETPEPPEGSVERLGWCVERLRVAQNAAFAAIDRLERL